MVVETGLLWNEKSATECLCLLGKKHPEPQILLPLLIYHFPSPHCGSRRLRASLPSQRQELRKEEQVGNQSQAYRVFPVRHSGVRNEEEREETCSAEDHLKSSASLLCLPLRLIPRLNSRLLIFWEGLGQKDGSLVFSLPFSAFTAFPNAVWTMVSLGFQTKHKASDWLMLLWPKAQIKKRRLNKRCLAQVLLSICRKFPLGPVTGIQKINPTNPCDWPQPCTFSSLFLFPMPARSESLGYSNCRENKTESALSKLKALLPTEVMWGLKHPSAKHSSPQEHLCHSVLQRQFRF